MKSVRSWILIQVAAVSGSLILTALTAGAQSRESRRIQPVLERPVIEKPVFARPGKDRPLVFVPPRTEPQPRETLIPVRSRRIMPVMESPSFVTPNTVEIFRRPRDQYQGEGFRRGELLPPPRHFVPGHGNNPTAYRVGTRPHIREHCTPYNTYYFRNKKDVQPDSER